MKSFIITYAQNATPVHRPTWLSLLHLADHLGAEIKVVKGRYKNPTSIWSKNAQADDWWAAELAPYLTDADVALTPHCTLYGSIRVQPTAQYPTAGFQSLGGGRSVVIAHPKVQLVTHPTAAGQFPKLVTTTGAVTKPNYVDSKAGALGKFHHVLGALVVRIDRGLFWFTHVYADSRGLLVFDNRMFTPDGERPFAVRAEALVLGDTHVGQHDKRVDRATFGGAGLAEMLNPQMLVWHDVFDGTSVNPHEWRDPMKQAAKYAAGQTDVAAELERAVAFVAARSSGRQSYIVASNHDRFLARWLNERDWKRDPQNASTYLALAQKAIDGAKSGGYSDPWYQYVKDHAPSNVRPLADDDRLVVKGVALHMHGDVGPNGMRGTVRNLSAIGLHAITGHGHSPAIDGGHTRVGTSSRLRLGYNVGPSSWLHAHASVDVLGKRHLHFIIKGRNPPHERE